ncbi:MAG: beta-propeller domain-containing protein [archaeon]
MTGTKKSIEMDIDDPRAGKIAEAMSSQSAKKILHLLAEREMSGSEIASELEMPLNTVGYNLKKLVEAGLVDKLNKSFWSSKGKKMELYKISNKKIIILPRKINRAVVAGIMSVLAVLIIAFIVMNFQGGENLVVIGSDGHFVGDDGLKRFSSIGEMEEFLKENSGGYDAWGTFVNDGLVRAQEASAVPSVVADGVNKAGGASDYSETNIQIEGVDEPDIVKNDGKYIYAVVGNKVVIVDAYPVESMEILSEMEFDDNVRNIFVNGDKLVVFTEYYEYADSGIRCAGGIMEYGVRCGGYSKQSTIVYVYDVSDREYPELDEEYEFSGNYVDARMIGDNVYVISSKWINRNWFDMPVHATNGVEKSFVAGDVSYIDAPDENYVFNLITAIDLDDGDVNTEVYLMGSSGNIFVSQDNIYLTYQRRVSQKYYFERYVDEVVMGALPISEREKVKEIIGSDDEYWEKNRRINDIIDVYVVSLEPEEGLRYMEIVEERARAFSEKMQKEMEKTIVHRIEIDGMEIDYEAKGEVPGRVLNQFSMDEYDGYFRIATTTGGWNRVRNLNHLYVLDMDLELVGELEDLAKGESIYSVRFMGERAYMVTFRQVDPLFAIDLSNPYNPKVLGELKVTGYSGYLHPYDENHLIGVGQEADENGRTQGVKISLFDVEDVSNPREIGKYEIGEGRWSYTDVLYEHKALLFDKERNLLVIPVSYTVELVDDDLPDNAGARVYPRYEYWQGAYVFDIDLSGISLRGKVSHQEKTGEDYYYRGGENVRRSLFMDDVLYTISNSKIKASDLWSVEEIEEVDLGYEEPDYYYATGMVE